jgi:hypothetical protein
MVKIQQSSDAGNANNGASTASEANLQKFMDTFVCQANTNGTGYFFFEVSFVACRSAFELTCLCYSTSMSLGKINNLAVLKGGGVYSMRSKAISFSYITRLIFGMIL